MATLQVHFSRNGVISGQKASRREREREMSRKFRNKYKGRVTASGFTRQLSLYPARTTTTLPRLDCVPSVLVCILTLFNWT